MTTLAILHTSTATVEPLRALAAELLPDCHVINFVDDSILPQLLANGGQVAQVEDRIIHYARFAAEAGADVILEACSSVGEVVPAVQRAVAVPVVRIDEAMADAAVARATTIGVAATLPTTLEPTTRLLQARAAAVGREVQITPLLVAEAYQRLMAGDPAGHDQVLAQALNDLAAQVECVVLAQASMAHVLPQLAANQRSKFLASPTLGMARVKAALEAHTTV